MSVKWSAADIKSSLYVTKDDRTVAVICQGAMSNNSREDMFILVDVSNHVWMPQVMNAAQMAMHLNEQEYRRVF